MADSSVTIDAGADAAIDTRTESTNSHHRQVIVVGDPSTNTGVAPVDGTAGLKVDLGADNDVTVTGSVTANAGTNLNTSALATSAKQDTIIGHVDGIEGAFTTLNAKDFATQTTLAAVLAAVDGLEAAFATLNGHVDGLEDGQTTLASKLDEHTAFFTDWDAEGAAAIGGDVAHDAADGGSPVKVGYKAIAHGTNPTAVAAADRTHGYANRAGIPFVIGGHPNVIARSNLVADSDGAQTNAALVAVAAGSKIVLTRLSAIASGANTVDVAVRVGFGTASVPTPALAGVNGLIMDARALDPGSGLVVGDGSGIIAVGADDEDLRLTCDDPVGGHLTVSYSYYTIES